MRQAPPVVMTIAGYDPSGGAGVTADIKTIAAHGCYAVSCITAVTLQTTLGVRKVVPLDPELVGQTLFELAADMPPAAVRVGMLGNGEVAEEVAAFLESAKPPNVVLDPILTSSSGARLLDCRGETVVRERLLRLASLITPNIDEAAALTGMEVKTPDQARAAARKLHGMGAQNVIVTGGHLDPAEDLLLWADRSGILKEEQFGGEKIVSQATHGTGCAFASAIACNLALGRTISDSVRAAKKYVRHAIQEAYPLGRGKGPLNHLF